jgi:hypothetical protein
LKVTSQFRDILVIFSVFCCGIGNEFDTLIFLKIKQVLHVFKKGPKQKVFSLSIKFTSKNEIYDHLMRMESLLIKFSERLLSHQDNHSVWRSAEVVCTKTSPKRENSFLKQQE